MIYDFTCNHKHVAHYYLTDINPLRNSLHILFHIAKTSVNLLPI